MAKVYGFDYWGSVWNALSRYFASVRVYTLSYTRGRQVPNDRGFFTSLLKLTERCLNKIIVHHQRWFRRNINITIRKPIQSDMLFPLYDAEEMGVHSVNAKLCLCLCTYWGSGDTAPRIPNLDTRWRWIVSFTPRPLYPRGKRPSYPLDRRLSGTQK
jgi:hypothetical protein